MPLCTCTSHTRCAAAWDLRDAFVAARRQHPAAWRPIVTAYTRHVQAAGEMATSPPGSEAWPCWADTDHPDPRKE